MSPTRRLVRYALVLAIAPAFAAPAEAGILGRLIQQRRAEYQLHKQAGAGPIVAAIPGKAGFRGAVLQQKAGARLREKFRKKREIPAISTTPAPGR